MRKHSVIILVALIGFWGDAEAGPVTLTLTAQRGPGVTNRFQVETNKVVHVLASYADLVTIWIVKNDIRFRLDTRTVIVGPATISLESSPDHWNDSIQTGYVTFDARPESFPPDKTIVIPEGGGANIALECSTNLIDWTAASLGVYTNQPTVKFFRLKAERVP